MFRRFKGFRGSRAAPFLGEDLKFPHKRRHNDTTADAETRTP